MDADDQDLFIIGSVENADPTALRQIAGRSPEKIVFQFGGAGMLEAEDLATLRIHPGHHVPDRSVLSRRVHRLKDQQDGVTIGRIVKLLERAQSGDMIFQEFAIILLRIVYRLRSGRPFSQIDRVAFLDAKVARVDLHFHSCGDALRASRSQDGGKREPSQNP